MKKIILLVIAVSFIALNFNCNPTEKSGVIPENENVPQSYDNIEKEPKKPEEINPLKEKKNIELVTYESATVYAGSTDYYFSDNKGEKFHIRISNMPQEKEIIVKIPEGMLETEAVEGPPGANPNMLGKQFQVKRNDAGEIIEIMVLK